MTNTILLADDSVTIQKVIELTFMDEDYEVVSVGNGDEALDRLEEVAPDVVIADVHMPGASGYDVARRAKQLHPQAPVLLLVGTFEPFDEADFHSSGADGYLKKPFDSQELLQRVSELMAARAGLAEEPAPSEGAGREAEPPPPPPSAAPPPVAGEAFAAPAAAPPLGDATRLVPTWDAEGERPWRPAEPVGEEVEPLGTRRIPVFRGEEPAGDEGAGEMRGAWSDWSAAGSPEEVEPPVEASAPEEPAWREEEPFEPAWEGGEEQAEAAETAPWEEGQAHAAGEAPWEERHAHAAAEEASAEEAHAPAAHAPREEGQAHASATETAPWEEGQAHASMAEEVPWEKAAASASAAGRPHHGDPFPELARPHAPAPPAASAAVVLGGAGNGAAVQLSDSDVDRVARRVAELLGDRVIREVAWEVVPDLAEVVIKDRLRELESQVD